MDPNSATPDSSSDPCDLFLDCSGDGLRVGILQNGEWVSYIASPGNALENLFQATKTAMAFSDCSWDDLHSVIFCQGPGSPLSLRVGAMAVQAWYQTTPQLAPPRIFPLLEAASHQLTSQGIRDFVLVAPGRKGDWHTLEVKNGTWSQPARIATLAELQSLPYSTGYWIPHRELGDELPAYFDRLLSNWSASASLFSPGNNWPETTPDKLLTEAYSPDYARWSGQIHQRKS